MPSKVLIIGAGPSGTACAATLHRLGHEVTVVDKATFPRDKCCGDGLTTNALRILDQLGFDPSRVPDWQVTSDVLVHSPTGRTIELALPDVGGIFAAIAPRSQFDHALVQHCRDAGITIHEGHAFVSLSETDTSVVVNVEGLDQFTVDYVVAADGMWSPVRKAMGLSTAGYLGEWHAFRQYIGNVTGSSATQLHVWFEKDLLPGYAWSFPLPGNRANFGYGILRTSERSTKFMNDTWRDLLTRPHIREALGPDNVELVKLSKPESQPRTQSMQATPPTKFVLTIRAQLTKPCWQTTACLLCSVPSWPDPFLPASSLLLLIRTIGPAQTLPDGCLKMSHEPLF